MVPPSKQPSRFLMDSRNGLFTEDRMIESGEAKVMVEVIFHALAIDSFKMAFCDHSRREAQRYSPVEFIQEIILSC
jgi:hypothetical protein